MKRYAIMACIAATLLLVTLVVFRGVAGKESRPGPSAATVAQIEKRVTEFVDVKTEPVDLPALEKAFRDRSGAGVASLTDAERDRLLGCIGRFYLSYSSLTAFGSSP